MAGMPLEKVTQWLGHSQTETSLIYANATTEMKQIAIQKISTKEIPMFRITKDSSMRIMRRLLDSFMD